MDPWLIIGITLLLSAFFSGMEIAFVSSNKLKIEVDKTRGNLSSRLLARFISMPSRFIGALLLGNNIALVVYGIAMTVILEPVILNHLPAGFQNEYLILLLQTLVSALLILFTAEFLPKALFRIKPNTILKVFAVPVAFFYYMFYPIIFIFIGISEWMLKTLFRVKLTNEKYVFSPLDLDAYIREFASEAEKEDEQNEFIMFQNAIEFKNVKLRECMIPRTEIVAVEEQTPVEELRMKFVETGHSKVLVYQESIDNVIGYTHSFDMFSLPRSLKNVLKSIIIAPETQPASELLKNMIQHQKSVAVVVDEFGGTSGMVTLEDIIEEIFGEIEDEYDIEDLTEKRINEHEFLFSARLEIDYLNDKYMLELPESEEYETLAGFIIKHHEDIPAESEEIIVDHFGFTIMKASENRIEQVHLRILEK
ncbi:MAG: hemolysin family protein [Bacteroidales bacterium]|nr:hemolysin family protein [Bacteroidales bacterium]MCF8343719.1 hemolysin family protein [Bacteroidales bacterium]MCF8350443.1 hemolysin family protein [Bacteroidales bacterium]MCF8376192.1 hemolysin family protein [Bacteroidales bacterium]MCF8401142.1 hemolysin family protein [Bacteroidales bacterium]